VQPQDKKTSLFGKPNEASEAGRGWVRDSTTTCGHGLARFGASTLLKRDGNERRQQDKKKQIVFLTSGLVDKFGQL
jgi:hypothetical protein